MANKRRLNSNNDSWVNMVNGISQAIALQQQQQQISNEEKYKQWMMQQQGARNQIDMAQMGYSPSNIPQADFDRLSKGNPPPVGLYTKVGDTLYRQNPMLTRNIQSLKSNSGMNVNPEYASAIADAIENGDQPPEMKGLYRYGGAVRGELAKRGFDLTKASRDWLATTKTINGLNSTQQVRMRQALDSVEKSIPVLQELNNEFKRTGFKDVNWVTVNAALKGVGKQRDLATKYISQINLMKDELAQGFMGGGIPTDRAFKLADDILQPFYGKEQTEAALKQLNYNLRIRKTAIEGITPLGVWGEVDNPKITGAKTQRFEIDGTYYDIPIDQVARFKKAKGIK